MSIDAPIIGIDLGGTNMQIGVCDHRGRVVARSKRKTKPEDGLSAVLERIVDGCKEACVGAGVNVGDTAGVGIGAPGAVDPARGLVRTAVNLKWNDVPLASLLGERLGIPVVVDNDVNVALYGEVRAGAAAGELNAIGVWVGTGIGGALVINGGLYYGPLLTAGEIGHMVLIPNNPPGHRSVEHNCSRTAVVDRIVRLIRSNRPSKITELVDGNLDKIKSKTLAEAYKGGDPLTVEVIDDSAQFLGITVASVVTLLSIDLVVLGGGLTEAIGRPFADRVQESAKRFAFPSLCAERLRVVTSKLEDDAGVVGAAMIAREKIEARAAKAAV
ncbi:MAG: ROK family protein [Phycisphaerales bacterium]|jgi:glucokinase|nr:ROK family protein [Phycisphaerales bacterium]